MRPGYSVPHAALTLDDSLAVGGMLLDSNSICPIIENMQYIESPQVTNEKIPRQHPIYLKILKTFIERRSHLRQRRLGIVDENSPPSSTAHLLLRERSK